MADDTTGTWQKTTDGKSSGESKIFNTSIRGWIALILGASLALSMFTVTLAMCLGQKVDAGVYSGIFGLFATSVGGALSHYFLQGSKEGQK